MESGRFVSGYGRYRTNENSPSQRDLLVIGDRPELLELLAGVLDVP